MTKLYLYSNEEPNNKLKKNIAFVKEISADIMSGTDIVRPTFFLKEKIDFRNINYLYWTAFNRYYYIVNATARENGMIEITCAIDVLQTYATNIYSLECLIERQEFKYDPMLPDREIMQRVGTVTQKKKIGTIGNTISYVLTTTGGAQNV